LGEIIRARVGLGDQLAFGDVEIDHRLGRDRAAAGLDAALPVEQQHAPPGAGQIMRGRGAAGAAADDDDFELLQAHRIILPQAARRWRARRGCSGAPMRSAIWAETRNSAPRRRTRRRRPARSSRIARIASTAPVPTSPPRPKAMACAAPQKPHPRALAPRRLRAGQRHHRADGGHREHAVEEAERATLAASGQPGWNAPAAIAASAPAEPRQPAPSRA
jgi:hypothetical protein